MVLPFQRPLLTTPEQRHDQTFVDTNESHHQETCFSCPRSRILVPSDLWCHSRRSTSLSFVQSPKEESEYLSVEWLNSKYSKVNYSTVKETWGLQEVGESATAKEVASFAKVKRSQGTDGVARLTDRDCWQHEICSK